MNERMVDVAVIGAGAAGLAAATVTANAGCSTVVIDREIFPGGILRQCIHNGFGLRYFKEELTGPEYAERAAGKCLAAGAELWLDHTVSNLQRTDDGLLELDVLSAETGVTRLTARAVMLAMGCRERNRGNLAIPGSRPAGVFTAGTAQKLLNSAGVLPGKSAVIVGSGDIGLIMARRLTWCGIEVKAVVEIMPHPSGLTRNIVQCLNDFDIPLYLGHAVVNICGKNRVSGVDIAPLADGIPQDEKTFHIDCDTLLFSVGLIPENELSVNAGVTLDFATGGAKVTSGYETDVPGIFAAGNVLHVHDLVDFVSEEAERAAKGVLQYLKKETTSDNCRAAAGKNLKYVVPGSCKAGAKQMFSFRPLIVTDGGELTAKCGNEVVFSRRIPFVRPAEMIAVEVAVPENAAGITFELHPGEVTK